MAIAIGLVLLAAFSGQIPPTRGHVDFSGEWQLTDVAMEALDIGGVTGGGGHMTIRQDSRQLAIDRMYGRSPMTFVVRLDGRDSVHADPLHLPSASVDLISRASWVVDSLVIETDRVHTDKDGKVSRTKTRETLSLETGKLVIVRTETAVGRQPITSKRVYSRKQDESQLREGLIGWKGNLWTVFRGVAHAQFSTFSRP